MKKSSLTIAAAAATLVAASAITMSAKPAHAQSEPFIGQLMLFGGNFCPRGWANADGQLLAISSNTALFSLYGTTYGGDGRTTFALPDLRGRSAVHVGNGPGLPSVSQGQRGGSTSFSIATNNMPSHSHTATAIANGVEAAANQTDPAGHALAETAAAIYSNATPSSALNSSTVTVTIANTGGGQGINQRSPFLVLRWCVALVGIFPSRN